MKPLLGIIGLSGKSVMMQVDHFHGIGETVTSDSLHVEPGGKGYNQAVAAARLGACVRFLSCIGEDADGVQCTERMKQEGVEANWIYSAKHTACANILTDKAGENQVTVFRGAADDLSASDVLEKEAWLRECDALLLQLECPIPTLKAALDIAQRHEIPVYLNPAPAHALPNDYLCRFALVIPNQQEALAMLSLEAKPSSAQIQAAMNRIGLNKLLVTQGLHGVLYISEQKVSSWVPPKVKAIDTVGAGDTFCSAFVLRTILGDTVEEAVQYAMKAAAISVQRCHVLDALPYESEIDAE